MKATIFAALSLTVLLAGIASWVLVPTADGSAEQDAAPEHDDAREHVDCAWCKKITEDDPQRFALSEGIGWYGTWEDAVLESARSGRPIMLHFASPRCENVPGVW